MASQSPLTLPIIDFSELSVGCPKWNLVKAQVKQALEDYGCFEALFPKIPLDIRKALFCSIEELFDLPLETKQKLQSYIKLPLYEGMGICDEELVLENMETFTNLLWPQGNADFRETMQSYSNQLCECDQMVRRMVLESLGLEDYMNEHMDSSEYNLRVMKYKVAKTNETEIGLGSHADPGIVTILHQNQVDGLEVQTKDGEWSSVTPSQDSFIVMIGISIHAWTNGRFHAPNHRVIMKGNEPRYSAALFSSPIGRYVIKAPEKIIDEQHPLLFKPFEYAKFLEFYYSNQQKGISTLKTYYNV